MTHIVQAHLVEHQVAGQRLGRHVEHDPASRKHAIRAGRRFVDVLHERVGGPLDQARLGSCTGNAAAGCLNTPPLYVPPAELKTEADAVDFYSAATIIDGYPGAYPPEDTGSSGLAVAKVLKRLGLIASYKWAFSIEATLTALMKRPVMTGVTWYEGFDNPDGDGRVKLEGQPRGGHEFELAGFASGRGRSYITGGLLAAWNSWGPTYGRGGMFFIPVKDYVALLHEQGDVTVLVR